jgi:hypothetical protein
MMQEITPPARATGDGRREGVVAGQPDSDRAIFEWIGWKVQQEWALDGIVDIQLSGTRYAWGRRRQGTGRGRGA